FQMLQSLAAFYDVDIDVAFEDLPAEIQEIVLHGSGKQQIPFTYINERGKTTVREHAFEGIIPNLERRYKETDSIAVREELAKYQNNQPCPECHGTRLRREARFVKIGEADQARGIYEINGWPLRDALTY
ncbi:excinuclease ABC subunit UvrA, partial [Escherichia coli]|nr:excinuclease ABC subunit UvrA [Escherichia coli]